MICFPGPASSQEAFPFSDPQPRRPRPQPRSAPVLDPAAANAAKEAGQQLAAENASDWSHDVVGEFTQWARRKKAAGVVDFLMEDFRAEAVCQPASHKAWGSLPRRLLSFGLVRAACHPDGSARYRPSTSVKTHAHPVRVWEFA